jgi:hypothetical protein
MKRSLDGEVSQLLATDFHIPKYLSIVGPSLSLCLFKTARIGHGGNARDSGGTGSSAASQGLRLLHTIHDRPAFGVSGL